MSQRKEILILEPSGRIHKEAFCTRPMVCPYCNGRGWFHTNQQEPETEPVPRLSGNRRSDRTGDNRLATQ